MSAVTIKQKGKDVNERAGSTGWQRTVAIFRKQAKETLKNKEILIQFVMFPMIALIMEKFVQVEGMPEHYFVKLFAVMYIGMAPLTVMAAIIAEEKEKHTLKMLLFSDVRPWEYLVGTGGCVWLVCMLGALVFGLTGEYQGRELVEFLVVMAVGIVTAMLFGAGIGTFSKNQMMATSLTVPIMLIFSFLPMLAMFNAGIEQVAELVYSQQIGNLLYGIGQEVLNGKSLMVLAVNMIGAGVLFGGAYKKCGLA